MVLFTFPNPFAMIGDWIGASLDQGLQGLGGVPAPVPAPVSPAGTTGASVPVPVNSGSQETTIVTGHFVPAASSTTIDLVTDAQKHTERFRDLVDSFDEDKQEWLEWGIRKVVAFFCYVGPFVLAVPLGLAVGDVFSLSPSSSSFMHTFWAPFAIHLLSVFLELLVPILGLATTISVKRALKDKKQWAGAVFVACLFLLVAIGNSFALFFLLEKGLQMAVDGTMAVVMLGRSFGPFIIDIGATTFLSLNNVKSLQKYLANERQKIVAVRDANQVNIELDRATVQAAIDRQGAVMDMQSKQQRAHTWNQIEAMQSEAMVEQARRNMTNNRDRGSFYRGVDY